jgi:hypothetical protein
MKMGIHTFRTVKGNTFIVDIGRSMTYGRVEDPSGELVADYGSISIPEIDEQDDQTIIVFTEFESQRLRGLVIRPVITLA